MPGTSTTSSPVASFTDYLRALATSARRRYYAQVVFARVQTDLRAIRLGPDVCRSFHLVNPAGLSIGAGTVLNGECYLNAQGGIRIGRFCHIGKGLTVLSSNHNYRSRSTIPYDETDILKPVSIGDAVWIGANVTIAPVSSIGDGAIVALGAVVNGEVPSCAIVAGNPAQVVGWRDHDEFERMRAEGAFA